MKTPPLPDDTALDALFAAARAARPDTARAEHGFETRLRARISADAPARGQWEEFCGWCWRLIPALAVVTLAAGLWALQPQGAAFADETLFTAAAGSWAADDDDLARWLTGGWLPPI